MTAKSFAFAALLLAAASSTPALAAGDATDAAGNGQAFVAAAYSGWQCYRYIKLPGRGVVGFKKWCPDRLPAIRV